jgi:thymidine phosphorylase
VHEPPAPLPQELIRAKRDGEALPAAHWEAFVRGLVDGAWSDAQVAAFAMAVCCRGASAAETTALTRAMAASGPGLDWRGAGERGPPAALGGPFLDKHSTGGVGDTVSLLLAPLVAACGGTVPMASGRGLGHTGGTLDKLEALPGFTTALAPAAITAVLQAAGCAIFGAGDRVAPADRRLYAIRDVTATVESLPLITASILSKKLAAGLDALVLDVKCGGGAFCTTRGEAEALAASLTSTARACGLRCEALITPMDEPLAPVAGNALEAALAIAALREGPAACGAPLADVTLALAARLLVLGGLAQDEAAAHARLLAAWRSGEAAERFARMVAAQGGPPDVLREARLPAAPVQRAVPAAAAAVVEAIDTRALGLAVVRLGGGRTRPGDTIDPRVGLAGIARVGQRLAPGEPLAVVHAASEAAATAAAVEVRAAFRLAR